MEINVAVQADSEKDIEVDDVVDKDTVVEFAGKLKAIAKLLNELDNKTPSAIKSREDVQKCLDFIKVISTGISEVVEFTESPLGQRAATLLRDHLNFFRNLAEIGVGTVIASIFLVVGQDVLDVTEDEFLLDKNNMESRMKKVQELIKAIEDRVTNAVNHLGKLRRIEDDRQKQKVLKEFDENVRLAKQDIEECEEKLKRANEDIAKVMEKITIKITLNAVLRGALFAGGIFLVWNMVKKDAISRQIGYFAGMSCLLFVTTGMKKPRYRQLQADFERYQQTQNDFQESLQNLKKRLNEHNEVRLANHSGAVVSRG